MSAETGWRGTIIAYTLPDGSLLSIATTLGTSQAITALTNASPPVATATGHTFSNGDFVTIKSGWQRLNDRVFRVANVIASTSFTLEGQDTTDTTVYPTGGGVGSAIKASVFVQIPQVLTFDTQGGDQQFLTFSFLEDNFERQIPTVFSAQTITFNIADDPTTPGYIAALAASRARAIRPVVLALPNGSKILFNGYISVNETPVVTKGQLLQSRASLTLVGLPVRYST